MEPRQGCLHNCWLPISHPKSKNSCVSGWYWPVPKHFFWRFFARASFSGFLWGPKALPLSVCTTSPAERLRKVKAYFATLEIDVPRLVGAWGSLRGRPSRSRTPDHQHAAGRGPAAPAAPLRCKRALPCSTC